MNFMKIKQIVSIIDTILSTHYFFHFILFYNEKLFASNLVVKCIRWKCEQRVCIYGIGVPRKLKIS